MCFCLSHLATTTTEFKQMTETPADLTTDGESYGVLIMVLTSMMLNFLTKKSKNSRILVCF